MNSTRKTTIQNVAASALVMILLGLGLMNTLDDSAKSQLETSFGNALTTFAVARGINAVISVVQGTEVALEPGGLGVILTPGEILDPANDLIERFSWIVLASATSLGAQIILLKVGTTAPASFLLIISAGILLISIWTTLLARSRWRTLVIQLAVLVIFLRFLVPIIVLVNEAVYRSVLSSTYISSQTVLENVEIDVQELQKQDSSSAPDGTEEGFINLMSRLYERTSNSINLSARYREYDQKIAGASKHIINLIAVFIFQTIVFPLMFLWLAVRLFRILIAGRYRYHLRDNTETNQSQR